MSAEPAGEPAVELRGVTKRFPGVVANRDVDLRVVRGQVHAVVGENGAGKSTLMKTLYGMHRPDEGRVLVDGREVRFSDPGDAIAAGIGMVHQHFMLADNLTVAENVVLGAEPRRGGLLGRLVGGRLDHDAARDRIRGLGADHGLDVDPDALVADLGVGERQRVEILKVLFRGARVVVLDEPTAVLVPQEVRELFAALEQLRREGVTVLFISHKLDEVLEVADRVTVLRAGTTVATLDAGATTAEELAELMVGSALPAPPGTARTGIGGPALVLQDVSVRGADGRTVLDHVDLRVSRGEVLGVAGVEGNGQAELVEAVIGLRSLLTGRVLLGEDRRDVTSLPVAARRAAGVGYVPEDRHRQGLLLDAPLWENMVLGHQRDARYASGPFLSPSAARRVTEQVVRDMDVRTPGVAVAAHALSGGNQQKLVLGREMSGEPALLVASHPTRGVDVGAQAAIWEKLRDATSDGLAVLLVSADLDELLGLSDRLVVLLRGRVVATFDPREVTAVTLGAAMTGASADAGAAA